MTNYYDIIKKREKVILFWYKILIGKIYKLLKHNIIKLKSIF